MTRTRPGARADRGGNLPLHLWPARAPGTLRAVLRAHPDGAAAPTRRACAIHLAARAANSVDTSTRAQPIRAEQKSGEPIDLPPSSRFVETPSFLQLHATHRDLLGLRADNLLPLRTA